VWAPLSKAEVVREARVYPSGEMTVSKRMVGSISRPPPARHGARFVRGMTKRGRVTVQRALVARSRDGRCQFVMLTLTSQDPRTDDQMREAFGRFLDRMTKHPRLRRFFGWNVWAKQDQARGVLHFHLVLANRLPRGLFRLVRQVWADEYQMGPGSVDILKFRSAKGAARYLGKYLSGGNPHHRVSLDVDGTLLFDPWPVSRHTGEPYVRDRFRGNPYGMSQAARVGTVAGTVLTAASDAFPGLDGWHGTRWFYDSPEDAEVVLAAAVAAGPSPVGGGSAHDVHE
jgi:hypothetical protein